MIHPNDGDERLNVGLEISYKNMVDFRGGYKFFTDEETFSAGIGLKVNNFLLAPSFAMPMMVDFSYSDYGRLGDVLRFTVQLGVL